MEGENKNIVNTLEYRERYQSIVEMPLSPENIDTYADDAMDRLGDLISDIQEKYKWEGLELSDKEREDKVFAEALPDVSIEGTLDRIDSVAMQLRSLDGVIQAARENPEDRVVLPPDEVEMEVTDAGMGGKDWERPVLPKLKTELFVLEQDFGVDVHNPDQLKLLAGVINPKMRRRVSYDVVDLPELKRLVLSCDEGGNKTYVFDTAKLRELKITPEMIKSGTKSQLNELLKAMPEAGKSITYSPNYVARFRGAIKDPASELISEKEVPEKMDYLMIIERAPDGWVTVNELAKELGVGFQTIQRYYVKNEDEIGGLTKYAGAGGRTLNYFSPEQAKKIREHFSNKKEVAPDGWKTVNELAKELGVGFSTIRRYYAKNEDEIGELTKYVAAGGRTFDYFSPDQVEKIREHFNGKGKTAPDGWKTINELAKELDVGFETIQKYCVGHVDEIGEPVEYAHPSNGRWFQYYSPEQIEKIERRFEKGWKEVAKDKMSILSVCKELGVTKGAIERCYESHKEELGPLEEYIREDGRRFKYFSAEQIARLRQYFSGHKEDFTPKE